MNINGVGAPTPVPAPMPVGPAPSPKERASTEAAKAAAPPERKSEITQAEEESAKLPPLKGLTVNDVRVMLGAMPPSAAAKLAAKRQVPPGALDVYA
jgi:hypothetical protein